MKLTYPRYLFIAVMALFIIAAFCGHPVIDPAHAAAMSAAPFMVGDTLDAGEIAKLFEKQAKNWEDFKSANDAKLKEVTEKGFVSAEMQEKLAKINADMVDIRKQADDIEKKANRPAAQTDANGKIKTPEQIAHAKAFANYLRKGDETGLADLQQKSMNMTSDPDGGYLVLPEIDQAIDRFAPVISAMAQEANTVTIGTAKWEKMVKYAGMSMRRVKNGATGGESTEPKLARIVIEASPAEVEPWIDNELLQDSFFDLEADLAMEAGIAFAEGAGAEYISGNGVGGARGILSYTNVANANYSWGNVGYIVSGKSGAFASVAPGDAIIKLQHGLKQQYRPGACFILNDATLGVARTMKDGSGQYYLWSPDVRAGFGGTFIGSPVLVDNNMPDIGAGSYSVAFGNFKRGYTIVNRAGISLIRDNITAKGTTKFNFRRRFGGGISHFEAIKLMKFATS